MSEFEDMPDCINCGHPASSHDDEFGDCTELPNPYGLRQWDGCDCPGYEEPEVRDER
jgi:hypothetical protein